MTTLNNKSALVTGASRGIGRSTAIALTAAGARVLVHYGHSAADAASVVSAITANGGWAQSVSADLKTPNGATELAEQARSVLGGRLDVLVSNAGISKLARIEDHTVEDFDALLRSTCGARSSLCSSYCRSLLRARASP